MKPADVFDRDEEWSILDRHVADGRARLGIVTGRRRVGKTFLLRRLADRHRGLFVSCLVEEREPALRRFADALGQHHGISLGPAADWAAAIEQATRGPLAVPLLVIDELPYLLEHSPELESVLQHAVDRSRDDNGTRMILAGSSLAIMDGLLGGGRPLRGRADLQLQLRPFDFRTAAAFWGTSDSAIAFRLHAVLGGSPGYRALAPPAPTRLAAFERWITDAVLNPAAALYREDGYLLAEDRRLADRSIYASILRAIAGGDHRPSRIAARVGRPQTSLTHALGVLAEAGFVANEQGLLSGRDPLYRLTDPMVTFLHACVEPWRRLIDEGRRADAWTAASAAWQSQVLGPHLELLARVWSARFASVSTLGGAHGFVGRAELADPDGRTAREVDVAVLGAGEQPRRGARVLAIGKAKLTADTDALDHLDRCAELLERAGSNRPARLIIFHETATAALRTAVKRRPDVDLVTLERLYHGE